MHRALSSNLQCSCCKDTIKDNKIISSSKSSHVVLQRLLDWMDRCDVAMQHGWAKPEFQTTTGEEIFPDSDEAWWLTEMSKRCPTEAPHPEDEDGPWEEDQEEEREELSDDDPPTSEDDGTPVATGANAEATNGVRRTITYDSNFACC